MEEEQLKTFVGRGGQLRYVCPDCPFDSYATSEIYKHWLSTHKPVVVPGATLFDAEDNTVDTSPTIILPPGLRNFQNG
jgi:hypothetical protein